jgi:hypothetical protein
MFLLVLLCACGDEDEGPSGPAGGRDAGSDAGRADGGGGRRDAGGDAAAMRDAAMRDAAGGRAESLLLQGTAEGSADEDGGGGDRVECSFSATIDMLEFESNGDFTGFVSGELFRTTYVGDGRFEFIPFVVGDTSLTHTSATEVELRFVGDQPDDAVEFWKQLEVITGEDLGDDRYRGEWLCAPGLLGDPGFMDIDLTVTGEWTLEPGP